MAVHDGSGGGWLLERDVALEAITAALGEVEGGGGVVVLFSGRAGVGKTSLLREGKRAAREAGFSVGSAVGSPMESGLPFGLLGQAVVQLVGSTVDDSSELQRLGDPAAGLYRMFRCLTSAAAEAPLLLALDDLHWADPDSLTFLGFLARRIGESGIMVLGSLRPEPTGASVLARELLGAGQARMLEVEALSREASVELVERTVPGVLDPAECERVWRACAGTPLLLEVAARTLGGGGSLPAASGEVGFGPSLLIERFVGVDGAALAFVRAASILGVRFRAELAGALAGLDAAQTNSARERLVRAGLIEDLGGGEAAFVHPLFAQALLEEWSASERESCHGAAFRLMVDRGQPDVIAAGHAVAARLEGDPQAIDVCARAGRAALAQGALEAASVHLQGAVELAGAAAPSELLLEYASALGARGQLVAAGEVCGRLLAREELDPAVRASGLSLLARTAMQNGCPAEAEQRYEQAAEQSMSADPATQVATLADAAITFQVAAPNPWSQAMILRALAVLPPGDTAMRGGLEFLHAYVSLVGGDASGAGLLAREARAWMDRGSPTDDTWGWGGMVHSLNAFKALEDFGGTTELFEREFARAVRGGAPMLICAVAISYSDTLNRLGRPREALELVENALALSEMPMAPWTDIALAALLAELGRDQPARQHVESLRAFLAEMPEQYYAPASLWLDLLDARRLLEVGEPARASERMQHASRIAELTGWREPCIVPWAGVAIEAHLAAGQIDLARNATEQLDTLSRRLPCSWPRAALELGRARLAAEEDRTGDADRQFEAALELHAKLPMPIAHAEALLAYGTHLRRSGRPREARQPITRACGLCERVGAERVARLARAELAATGGRRRRDHTRHDELTAQEQRVASLAGEGMTNAQIASVLHISSKTVGHHLQRVYGKLEIHSRRELIRRGRSPTSG